MGSKITIEPVTRIEGHAKVTVHLDDAGRVERARLHVNEFRGFEKFCEGRLFHEMPLITERICGICPVSHHLASAKACDHILGVTIPRTARLLRELMHMGQTIQSHAMHFFELAGPDLLLGFVMAVRGLDMKNGRAFSEMEFFDLSEILRDGQADVLVEYGLVRQCDFTCDRCRGCGKRVGADPEIGDEESKRDRERNELHKWLTGIHSAVRPLWQSDFLGRFRN